MIEIKIEKQTNGLWFWSLKVNGLWEVIVAVANTPTQAAENAEKWIVEKVI